MMTVKSFRDNFQKDDPHFEDLFLPLHHSHKTHSNMTTAISFSHQNNTGSLTHVLCLLKKICSHACACPRSLFRSPLYNIKGPNGVESRLQGRGEGGGKWK